MLPVYEFRCNETGQHFEVSFRSIEEYDTSEIRSPYTGSTDVTRIIRQVALRKTGRLSMDSLLSGDENTLEALENADPETLGRSLRALAQETGEDMGGEFDEIVNRLEKGESPEQIESSLPSDDIDN